MANYRRNSVQHKGIPHTTRLHEQVLREVVLVVFRLQIADSDEQTRCDEYTLARLTGLEIKREGK